MATFEETVLALNPLLFWRCKDLVGPTITDYSGNEHHGTVVSGTALLGQQSGVETDPDARSVYLPGGFANNICELDPTPAPLLFTGNFTIACFVRHQEASGFQYLMGRGGLAGGTASGLHFFTTGSTVRTLHGRIITAGGADDVDAETSYELDADHFVTFTRNDTVLQLRVGGVLVGENAVASNDPLEVEVSHDLVFGAAGNNLGPLKGWASELIICDYAWTLAQGREVYESAINAVFISGVSNVIPTAVLYSDFPTDPVSWPFRWNWSEVPVERLSFATDISTARTGAEEGNGLRVAPRREFEFVQVLRTNAERRRFRALLWSKQHQPWWVPVRQHAEQLVAPLTTGATTIPAMTTYRDYEVGGYVGLRQLNDAGDIVHWEERLITGLVGGVQCEATVNDYAAYLSWTYPVKRALLTPAISPHGFTDTVEQVPLTARLLPEDEAEVPNRIVPWTRTLAYRDYEVFDPAAWPSHNWDEEREYEVERLIDEVDFGAGRIGYESDTAGAAETIPYRLILDGNEAIARFLGWWYERKGQLRYLWVPTMQRDFEVLAVDGDELTVSDTNYSDAFALAEPRRDLTFVYNDNTMELRRVVAFAGTPDETLTLDFAAPSLTNLRSVSLLKFCRLDANQIELAYETDNKAVVVFSFREMLHSPEGTGRSSLSPSASPSASGSPSHSPSPSASPSATPSVSVSPSPSPSLSVSISPSVSASVSQSASVSPSSSGSASPSPSASTSPSSSESTSVSPSPSASPSV
jgi:hypothetical protein